MPISSSDLRERLQDLVLGDLLGPANGEHEIVDETRVSDRYVLGLLAPKRQRVQPEKDDGLAEASNDTSEEGSAEPSKTPPMAMQPSSLGLTFAVHSSARELEVSVSWGRYERSDRPEGDDRKGRVWRRIPMSGRLMIPVKDGRVELGAPCPEEPEVTIQGLIRRRNDSRIVTLFLVNGQEEPERLKDEKWLFQPRLSVKDPEGRPVFVRRATTGLNDDEAAEMAMLYRRQVEFAVGHGVSVHAVTSEDDPWRATRLETRTVPGRDAECDVPQQTPPTAADPDFEKLVDLVLDMKELGHSQTDDLILKLNPLVAAYGDWIEREEEKVQDPKEHLEEHAAAAARVIRRCRRALERIRAGIELLSSNEDAADAFRFANRAMALQRVHSIFAESQRRGGKKTLDEIDSDPRNRSWRPFQLAFILLNLPGSTDLHHPDRSDEGDALADLLWFPTGGGKTEAYLGMAAYVLGLRRLQGEVEGRDGEHGVAVLMRYTLRLLTLQQFQRASALICACETIRREDEEKWGRACFRIGLWVGQKATPNWTDQAAEWIRTHRSSGRRPGFLSGVGSPAQIPHCPWCGHEIEPGRDLEVETFAKGRGRTLTFCSDPLGKCVFSRKSSPGEGLPIVVVDEEIYRLLPSLIVATVDKFAQMPWDGRAQMLFGRVSGRCPRHGFRSAEVEDSDSHPAKGKYPAVKTEAGTFLRPPDLIIQDELHLISGPLGSLVGLYETAVDALCSWTVGGKRVRPKVIASTATIRNAMAQVNSLFLRRVEVFPPPGTSVDDNFFSIRRKPREEFPGRRYLGICAPGKRLKAVLIRVYVALLGASKKLWEEHEAPIDPWMTLVGYFNSLRELGGMRRLVDDDVRTRLRRIDIRGLGNRRPPLTEELTSRKGSGDIPRILDLLEVPFDPEDERLIAKKQKPKGRRPLDVLLATNMMSVGVDVQRLGLMVMAGQPKTTAEYIQATSRVGRRHPGLVCTVYNWARPRDLSHWERFEHYHATFYERVESLSVTPFAARAVDRALTALLVSLIRLESEEFNANAAAGEVHAGHETVRHAVETIAKRAGMVLADNQAEERLGDMLRERLDEWLDKAQKVPQLGYRFRKDGKTTPLLSSPGVQDWESFTCLTSLRDVEATSPFVLVDDGSHFPDLREDGS